MGAVQTPGIIPYSAQQATSTEAPKRVRKLLPSCLNRRCFYNRPVSSFVSSVLPGSFGLRHEVVAVMYFVEKRSRRKSEWVQAQTWLILWFIYCWNFDVSNFHIQSSWWGRCAHAAVAISDILIIECKEQQNDSVSSFQTVRSCNISLSMRQVVYTVP